MDTLNVGNQKGEETLGKSTWETKDRAVLTGDAGLAHSLSVCTAPHTSGVHQGD